jgi:hypothetical protein
LPSTAASLGPAENLLPNGDFKEAFAQRTYTGLSGQTEILPEVYTYHSGSTMDVEIEDTPPEIARLLPPGLSRTTWIDSTEDPDDYSGIRWILRGADALALLAEQEVTATIYGRGPVPEKLRCGVFNNFGTGGSDETFISALLPMPVAGCELWLATVKLQTKPLADEVVGTDPYVVFAIDNYDSASAWGGTGICGAKLEAGPRPTPFIPRPRQRLMTMGKARAVDDTAIELQTNGAGRAKLGLLGSDDVKLRVSADGLTWHDAITANRNTGALTLGQDLPVSEGGTGASTPLAARKSLGVLGLAPNPILYRSDSYILAPSLLSSNPATGAIVAGRLYLYPLPIANPGQVTRIGIGVSVGAAGNARLGVYATRDDLSGAAALLLDSGNLSVAAAGDVEQVIDFTPPNSALVWVALLSDVAPTLNVSGAAPNVLGMNSAKQKNSYLYRALAFGALPADESAQSYSIAANAAVPLVWLRKV